MDTTKTIAALFDFDGVIMDTETQYTVFWDEQGRKYLNEEDFGRRIKGQTLCYSRKLVRVRRLLPRSASRNDFRCHRYRSCHYQYKRGHHRKGTLYNR